MERRKRDRSGNCPFFLRSGGTKMATGVLRFRISTSPPFSTSLRKRERFRRASRTVVVTMSHSPLLEAFTMTLHVAHVKRRNHPFGSPRRRTFGRKTAGQAHNPFLICTPAWVGAHADAGPARCLRALSLEKLGTFAGWPSTRDCEPVERLKAALRRADRLALSKPRISGRVETRRAQENPAAERRGYNGRYTPAGPDAGDPFFAAGLTWISPASRSRRTAWCRRRDP